MEREAHFQSRLLRISRSPFRVESFRFLFLENYWARCIWRPSWCSEGPVLAFTLYCSICGKWWVSVTAPFGYLPSFLLKLLGSRLRVMPMARMFAVPRRVCQTVAKSMCTYCRHVTSVYPQGTERLPTETPSWSFILGIFTKMFGHIPILVKIWHKLSGTFREDTYVYKLSLYLVFMIETGCVLCGVRAQARMNSGTSNVIDCKSSRLQF